MTDTHPSSADAAPPRRLAAAATALPALLAVLVYANTVRNGFAIDDEYIVQKNPVVHGLHYLHDVLLGSYWPNSIEMYRPVTLLTFALDWAASGGSAAWMHGVNALLHAVATALVARLVLRLGGGAAAAGAAAAVFAVHPLHVEAVANLVGRAEVLATIFSLLACLLFLARRPPPAVRIAGVAALYFVALGSKEIAVTLPALLLVLDGVRSRDERIPLPRIFLRNLPLLAVLTATLGAYLVLRRLALGGHVGTAPAPYLADLTTGGRLALAVRLWPEYLRLFFWPASLSPEWGPDAIIPVGWGSPRVWLGLACGAAAAAAAWVSWRRERWVVSGVLWCGLTLLPVSQIPFAVGVMIAERTMYLPSVGLAFLFPPLVRALRRERAPTRRAVAAMLAVAVALGAWKTWSRNPIWNTSFTVFDSMVDEHPHLWWVEWKAGQILARSGHGEEALPWYRKALVKTRFKHYNMLMDYASSLIAIGHRDEAARILDRAIRIGPDAVPARVLLSSLLIDEGRFPEAVAAGRAALRVPKYGEMSKEEINDRLAVAYDAMGRTDSALVLRRSTLGHFVIRHAFETWFHYARLLKLSGDDRGAAAALDSARARVAPHLRGRLTLDPLPSATALEVKGWTGMIVQQPAALGAATFQGAAPGGDSAAPRRRR